MKNLKKLNPYNNLAILIGYLFFPLTFIKKIKNDILPLIKLINKIFVNSHLLTFLAIWYPLIFIGILANVGAPQFMIFGIGTLIPMIIGVQVLPQIILNLKNSSVLKRMGATSTKTSDLTMSFIFYFSMVSLLSTFFNIGLGISFYSSQIHFGDINWLQLFIAIAIGIVVANSFGMLLAGVIRNQSVLLVVGLLLTLPGAFLSGQFLPPNLVNGWGPVRYISFIFPQKLSTTFAMAATNGFDMFAITSEFGSTIDYESQASAISLLSNPAFKDLPPETYNQIISGYTFNLVNKTELIMAYALAPTYFMLFTLLTIKFFKWQVK